MKRQSPLPSLSISLFALEKSGNSFYGAKKLTGDVA